VSIDPGQPGGPPVINISTRSIAFSTLPRLLVGLLVALAAFALVGVAVVFAYWASSAT